MAARRPNLAGRTKFNRPDPMRDWDWENPASLNLYQYVRNNPVNSYDPTGFQDGRCTQINDCQNKRILKEKPGTEEYDTVVKEVREERLANGVAALIGVAPYATPLAVGLAREIGIRLFLRMGASLTKVAAAEQVAQGVGEAAFDFEMPGTGLDEAVEQATKQTLRASSAVMEEAVENSVKVGLKAIKFPPFSRPLSPKDLGLEGKIDELTGTFSLSEGVAHVRIDMLKGEIKNPLQVMSNLMNTAREYNAKELVIEATIVNERLYNVLVKRYGLQSDGATDTIRIPLGDTND